MVIDGLLTVINTILECILRSAELTAPRVYIFTTTMRAIRPHILPMFQKLGSHGIPTKMASKRKGIGMMDGVVCLVLILEIWNLVA